MRKLNQQGPNKQRDELIVGIVCGVGEEANLAAEDWSFSEWKNL